MNRFQPESFRSIKRFEDSLDTASLCGEKRICLLWTSRLDCLYLQRCLHFTASCSDRVRNLFNRRIGGLSTRVGSRGLSP